MIIEKKKLLIYRIVAIALLIVGIIVPIVVSKTEPSGVEIVDSNCYVEYYDALDSSDCEFDVTFNKKLDGAQVQVNFYDEKENFLGQETIGLYGIGEKTLTGSVYFTGGNAGSYEIISYVVDNSLTREIIVYVFVVIDIILAMIMLCALLLSCKIYEYKGVEIIVYAGWYHHYIKVDGKKYDEHNTISTFVPINLFCILDDGTQLDVVISTTNRIALKINNQLYN